MRQIKVAHDAGQLPTGLLYYNDQKTPFDEVLNLSDTPLALLPGDDLRPSQEQFEAIMQKFMG